MLAEDRTAAALDAAGRAEKYLENFAVDLTAAMLATMRAQIAWEDFDAIASSVARLEQLELLRPAHLTEFQRLKLDYAILRKDQTAAERAFEEFSGANKTQQSFVTNQHRHHYKHEFDQQKTKRELELIYNQRQLTIGIVAALTLAAIAFIFLNSRRALQARIRKQLSEKNALLSDLVEEKSTELVEKVQEQAQLENALEERRHMETIGHISGHMGHEFNEILQVIASCNDMLAQDELSEKATKALGSANQSVRAGGGSVRELLSYSRNQKLVAEACQISKFLKDNETLFRSTLGSKNRLSISDESNGASVYLDSGLLTGGSTKEPSLVQLQVTDQGVGMIPEQLEHVTRPYYSTKKEGTGLGLSSVQGFAIQSGGNALITSEPDVGTKVSLRFPEHLQEQETQRQQLESEPRQLAANRILVVEDNPLVGDLITALLERHNFSIQWAKTANEAQEALAAGHDFDVLLTDVEIPGTFDGYGLAQWAKAKYSDIHIGMMTGLGQTTKNQIGLPVLYKPFTESELFAYLALVVDGDSER